MKEEECMPPEKTSRDSESKNKQRNCRQLWLQQKDLYPTRANKRGSFKTGSSFNHVRKYVVINQILFLCIKEKEASPWGYHNAKSKQNKISSDVRKQGMWVPLTQCSWNKDNVNTILSPLYNHRHKSHMGRRWSEPLEQSMEHQFSSRGHLPSKNDKLQRQ